MECSSVVTVYPVKFVEEKVIVTFDFMSVLASDETISAAGFTASVYSGIDSNPQAIVSGSAQIFGTEVRQLIIGGKTDTVYNLLCTVTTSNGQTFTPFVRLPVKSAPY